MTKLQSPEGHRYPGFDVGREEDKRAILDYKLQIGVKKLQNQIEIGLRRENVEQLNQWER